MKRIDSHTHPFQQRRCYEELELFAKTALAKGLDGIVFTEHAPMIFDLGHHFLTEDELALYLELGEKCKEAYRGRLDITVGIEADYFPDNMEHLSRLIDKYRIPYVSASIHFHLDFWKQRIGVVSDERRTELALKAT
ncbi:MAG: PHP domain-containing protein, partial [Victivallales bacterium]|nr:PHP domain-containing protein [Victivallales bacterium]